MEADFIQHPAKINQTTHPSVRTAQTKNRRHLINKVPRAPLATFRINRTFFQNLRQYKPVHTPAKPTVGAITHHGFTGTA